MLKTCMTFTLMVFFLLGSFVENAEAKAKKKKARTSTSYVSKGDYKKKKKYKKNRIAKSRRYKRSGNGPDLRALTTERPNSEYIETPDNGVNALEIKSEL